MILTSWEGSVDVHKGRQKMTYLAPMCEIEESILMSWGGSVDVSIGCQNLTYLGPLSDI